MKKFLTSAGLVALGVSGLQAAYAPDLTPIEASKPWSLSAALRGFYDDNYTTSVSGAKRDSFGYEFRPSASLNLPLDQTFVGLSYEYSLKYFDDDDHYDQSHQFNGRLDHKFSERYKIKVDESFVIAQEPEVIDPSTVSTPLRTEGDNIRNLGSILFTAQMTELLALELGYANTYYDYKQDGGTAAFPSRSGLLDRMEHLASLDLRWQALPDTDVILGYAYNLVNFTGDEVIGIDPTTLKNINSDDRNSRTHRVTVGVDHRFNARLSGSVRVGGEFTDYYNSDSGDNSASPYADASLTYEYNRGNSVLIGIKHTRSQTDVGSLDQEATVLYGAITHKITPNLIGSLVLKGQRSTFEGGSGPNEGDHEILFTSGLNLTYQFNPYFSAEAGYDFDNLDSQVVGRDYRRNRVYLGVRATF